MSCPLSDASFTVRPDAVEALALELGALAAELTEDAELARSAAVSFPVALDGHEGWAAGATAVAWACLYAVLAARTRALSGTVSAAAAAYVAEDSALAGRSRADRAPR